MRSTYWIKLYHEILHDPKMGRLSDHLWRRTIELFLLAGENGQEGALPSLDDMTWTLRTSPDELTADLEALAADPFNIVMLIDGAWTVTQFAKRQAAMSSTERSRRHRASMSGNVIATPPQRDSNETLHCISTSTSTSPSNSGSVRNKEDVSVSSDEQDEPESRAFEVFLQVRGGAINSLMVDQLGDLIDEAEVHRQGLPRDSPGAGASGDDWVAEAIKIANAATSNANIAYISAILKRWYVEGYKSAKKSRASPEGAEPAGYAGIREWMEEDGISWQQKKP